jgi:hypothetical protein
VHFDELTRDADRRRDPGTAPQVNTTGKRVLIAAVVVVLLAVAAVMLLSEFV